MSADYPRERSRGLGDGGNLLLQAFPREVALPEEGGAAVGGLDAAIDTHGATAADQAILDRDAAVAVVAVSVPALADVEHDTEGLGDVRDDAAVGANLRPGLLEVDVVFQEALNVDAAFGEELLQPVVTGDAIAVVLLPSLHREETLRLEVGANAGGDTGLEERKGRLDAHVIHCDADVQGEARRDVDPVDVKDSAGTVGRGGVLVELEPVDDREIGGGRDDLLVDVREAGVDLGQAIDVGEQQVGLGDDRLQPLDVSDAGLAIHGADQHVLEGLEVSTTLLHDLADLPAEALLLHRVGAEDVADAQADAELLEGLVVLFQQYQYREPCELARIVGEGAEVQGQDQQAGDFHQRIVLGGVAEVFDGFDSAVAGVVAELLAAEVEADEGKGAQPEKLADLCEIAGIHGVLLGRKRERWE